jgi:hypothetical protein
MGFVRNTNRFWYKKRCMCLTSLAILFASSSYATSFLAEDVAELEKAVSLAGPGDVVLLSPGIYPDARISTSTSNIVIAGAELDAPPVFTGSSSFLIRGSNVVLKNVIFSRITSGSIVQFVEGSGSGIEGSIFLDCGNNEISWRHLIRILAKAENVFVTGNKFLRSKSSSVGVVIKTDIIGGYHTISNNYFSDTIRTVENGLEAVQIGQSKEFHHVESHVTINENQFDDIKGDEESISIKSSRNTVSGNLFHSSSSVTLRGGESNQIENNCFVDNAIGIRVYGKGHVLSRNIFISNGMAIYLYGADKQSLSRSTHEPAEDILLERNIFVNPEFVKGWNNLVNRQPPVDTSTLQLSNNQLFRSKSEANRIAIKVVQINDFHDLKMIANQKLDDAEFLEHSLQMTTDGISPFEIGSIEECANILNQVNR